MIIKSLTARVLLLTTIWSAMALVAIGFVISTLYRNSAERGFQDLLRAQLNNVINSVTIGEQGTLAGNPQLGDLRYAQPKTGWYWIVEPLGTFTSAPLVSPSLGSVNLPVLSVMEAPFNKSYERYYIVTDSVGNRVQVAETEIVFVEGDGRAARFRVTGNIGVIEADVETFSHSLYLALGVFGIGSLIVNALAILYGLRPLDEARGALERIRAGESERLQGDFPREILPLANEVNALIDSNRRIVERARMQVGNLAHSLKTPIAVLLNESRVLDQSHGDLVKGQAEAMQGQVQSYLNRARIAAQRDSVLARTEAEPALERLVRVMRRLNTEIEFQLTVSPGLALAMEQQDLEETVGNLLENAARFAKTKVIVTASEAAPDVKGLDPARRHWVALTVEDDGPGLEPDQIREAMKRGRRLDETKPGTGLGLSIVSEITAEYQGLLTLSRGSAGGLQAALILPGIVKDVA
ncbi:ATP-binding protein [Rhizobium tumorigenes]|uniref:ATP-binding protein n=1 Tax=Rhizobium tumorigenes TaxID=2041385 RepID=UPI00241F0523|nr:HAMP domain-containing sensor histidine kinase [Rhizobium tumorigenes]WFS01763.1 HAMP domain-containing sensor histidine kinase [Rhizobium tumorigenes]